MLLDFAPNAGYGGSPPKLYRYFSDRIFFSVFKELTYFSMISETPIKKETRKTVEICKKEERDFHRPRKHRL